MEQYPWFKSYPEGIPHEIDPDQYGSVLDILEEGFSNYSDLPAFENMGKVISYREADELSDRFAAYLQHIGMVKGDRLAVQMPNLLQYPIVIFGALKAGLIVVNTNPLYTPREMKHQFNDSQSKGIVILANFAHNLEEIIKDTSIEKVIITEIGDMLGGLKGSIVNFVVKHVKKMVPAYNLEGAVKWGQIIKELQSLNFSPVEVSSEDIAFLQYTGGTTGVSKGATLTHRNICANTLQVKEWFINLEPEKEVLINPLPLYHIFALTATVILFKFGAKNVLITNPKDLPAFIKELKKHECNVLIGVNTLFNALLHHPDFKTVDFSKLKLCVAGGMALQRFVAEEWKKVTNVTIAEGYGLSETSPVLTCNPVDGSGRLGTIGLPVSSTEVKIMDDNGQEVSLGESGEICARGPQVMPGYWNRPDETAKCFFGEWFRTGDIGIMDEDGFFRIVDRKKDMILVSGFNVYPNEIEDVVAKHPDVLEVAAIGVPDEHSTEAVKLFVVKKNESLTEEEVKAFCKENMTNYKRPKHIEFRNELPKSNVGKILRRILKEEEAAT